jgi:hypothetical protein
MVIQTKTFTSCPLSTPIHDVHLFTACINVQQLTLSMLTYFQREKIPRIAPSDEEDRGFIK